jgi:hypothetical protein
MSYTGIALGAHLSIYNIQLSPPSPQSLQLNEHVNITFDYYTPVFGDWGWKLATSVEDAHNFINGLGGYSHPVKDAAITAVWTGTQTSFYIFYTSGTEGQIFGDWGWKLATNITDAHNFINGLGPYSQPVKYARICAVWTGSQNLFYIFYKHGESGHIFGNWGWKLSTSIEDAHNFINGLGGYSYPVQNAGITAVWTGSQTWFYIFYKPGTARQIFGNWGWKLATSIDDAHNFINGLGAYGSPVKYARITAVSTGTETLFYIFYRSGDPDEIRVFIRPFTDGTLSPHYAAHMSSVYPAGIGSGTGWFTITSGEVTVDLLRFQVTNADQSVLLSEFYIPVEYHFNSGTDVDSPPANLGCPTAYHMHQNYPNPFNPVTKIRYELPQSSEVMLRIFNLQGKEVRTLVRQEMPAGYFKVLWDGKDDRGKQVANGIYLYTLVVQDLVLTRKMILLR